MGSSWQSFVEKMGSNFLVATFVPSLAFVTSIMFFFDPVFPAGLKARIGGTFNPIGQSGLIALVVTIILAYTLTSLNVFFLKLFEGYILFWRFPVFRKLELKKYSTYRRKMILIERRMKYYEKHKGKVGNKILKNLQDEEINLLTEFQDRFPGQKNEVLPFRFGNVLKAAEYYPMDRYRIDAVPLWTRLISVIPQSYDEKIDQTHNQLSFLVNCSVLSIMFAFASVVVALYESVLAIQAQLGVAYLFYFMKLDLSASIYLQRTIIYLILGILACGMAIIFHRASLISVGEFGDMIRSTYDLFRFDLLKQLHFPLPINPDDELNTWTRVSRFMNIGHMKEMKYPVPPTPFQHDWPSSLSKAEKIQDPEFQDADKPKP
jgi:hypothetical protein